MIRVLHVVNVLARDGGLSNFIMNYYRNIDRTEIQFDFIYFKECESDFKEEIEALGGRYYKLPKPSLRGEFSRLCNAFFKEHEGEYTAMHCHALFAPAFMARIAEKYGVKKIIFHSHNTNYGTGIIRQIRNRVILSAGKRRSNTYAACSYPAGQFMYGERLMKSGKVYVINNSIACENYAFNEQAKKQIRNELGIKEDAFVLGNIAGFVPRKNHTFLIDVFAEIKKQLPNAVLLLLGGDGTAEVCTKADIIEKVNRLELTDSVCFLGVRKDVNRVMSAMDIFVMPSLSEGASIALIEAQAAGLRCTVATSVPIPLNCDGRVQAIPLEEGATSWAQQIIARSGEYDRAVDCSLLKDFDIKCQASKLMRLYLD